MNPQLQVQERIERTWAALPDNIRVADAAAMPFGGERNLALRKALGIPLGTDEVAMVTQADIVQVVTDTRKRADRHRALLGAALKGWTVTRTQRPDRAWLVTAHQ